MSHQDKLSKTLQGEYNFDVMDVIKRANSNLTRNFSSMFQACFILFVCVIALSFALVFGFDLHTTGEVSAAQQTYIEIISVFVISPLQAGLYMMGVKQAQDKKVAVSEVFSYLGGLLFIVLTQLLVSFMVKIGMALFIFPGIYLWIATIFSLPLVVDKGMTPLNAIAFSIKVVNCYLSKMLLFTLVFMVLFALIFVTFGLALIWVGPLYFCAVGVLYNDMLSERVQRVHNVTIRESSFDA